MEFLDQISLIIDLAVETLLDLIRMSGLSFSLSLLYDYISFELLILLRQVDIVYRNLDNWSCIHGNFHIVFGSSDCSLSYPKFDFQEVVLQFQGNNTIKKLLLKGSESVT